MTKQPDVRDRLIDTALTLAALEDQVAELSRRIRAHPCEARLPLSPDPLSRDPCWKLVAGSPICQACESNAPVVAERRRLRRGLGPKRGALRRAAAAFRRSIFGAARVPTSAPRRRRAADR